MIERLCVGGASPFGSIGKFYAQGGATKGEVMGNRLDGKRAVVTGGANGIGRACAERFAAEGASVVVADVQEEVAAAVASAITEAGGASVPYRLDATSEADNEALIAYAESTHGPIDVLVTAAGVSHGGYHSGDTESDRKRILGGLERDDAASAPIADLDVENWRRVLDVNLTGTMLAVRAASAAMVVSGRPGSIVTIASIAARDPLFGDPAYPVSKAGVWMLTKSAARTLAPMGIRVNAIGPGFIETNMTAAIDEFDELENLVIGQTPMGRKGRPDEVASLALFLAGDEASYITGELIHPDGGWFTG